MKIGDVCPDCGTENLVDVPNNIGRWVKCNECGFCVLQEANLETKERTSYNILKAKVRKLEHLERETKGLCEYLNGDGEAYLEVPLNGLSLELSLGQGKLLAARALISRMADLEELEEKLKRCKKIIEEDTP